MLPKASEQLTGVVKRANEIARSYGQEYVGTEHVLLAIQQANGDVGAQVLAKRGVTAEKLQSEIDKLVKKRMEETWVFGRLPGTPHWRNVMAIAIDQCQQLEARQVSTEHLLLALVKENGCVAQKALKNLGVTYEDIRNDILKISVH